MAPTDPVAGTGTALSDLEALLASAEAIDVVKRPVSVAVAFARSDGKCDTQEGSVLYCAGDAILTGVKGERWPIARAPFLAAYAPSEGVEAGQDGIYTKRPLSARAIRLRTEVAVAAGNRGSTLHGHPGDWLVRYADESHGIVTDDIFRLTYRRQ